jgi:hypothetical protein
LALVGDVDDLIERLTSAGVGIFGHSFHLFRLSRAPIEGFGLVGKDVTCGAFRARDPYGKRIGVVVGRAGHWQTNDDARALVEFARRVRRSGLLFRGFAPRAIVDGGHSLALCGADSVLKLRDQLFAEWRRGGSLRVRAVLLGSSAIRSP